MQPSPIPLPAPAPNSSRRESRSEGPTDANTSFAERLSQDRSAEKAGAKPADSAAAKTEKADSAASTKTQDAQAAAENRAAHHDEQTQATDQPGSVIPDLPVDMALSDLRNPDGSPVLDPNDAELDPLLAALASILNALPTTPPSAPEAGTGTKISISTDPLFVQAGDKTQATPLLALGNNPQAKAAHQVGEATNGASNAEQAPTLPLVKALTDLNAQKSPATVATSTDGSNGSSADANTITAQAFAAGQQEAQQQQTEQDQADHRAANGAIAITGMKPVEQDDSTSKTAAATPAPGTELSAISDAKAKAPAPRSEAPNPMDRAVANQVTRTLVRQAADGSRTISLRLTPPELGTVRIDIVERSGVLTAHLHAEDDAVRVALERSLGQLRQDLRSHDAPVRDVQMGDAWSSDLTRQRQEQQQGRQRARRDGSSAFSLDGVSVSAAPTTTRAALGGTITNDLVDARA